MPLRVEGEPCPNNADPAGPGATLSGRSLASPRPQPGCELGLRRTLLADPGSYSLCLPASAAALQWTSVLSVSHLPKYHLLASHLLQGKVSFLLPSVRSFGVVKQKGERKERKERGRRNREKKKKNRCIILTPPQSHSLTTGLLSAWCNANCPIFT